MTEIVRPRLSEEQAKEQLETVKKIAELTTEIEKCISGIHGKTAKEAFQNSVINLRKKCEIYGKEKESLTPEEREIVREAQKQALAEFRAKKENKAVSTNLSGKTDKPVPEISEENVEKIKHEKKGKKH